MNMYEAKEGFVFDWAEPRYDGEEQLHLYAKVLFLGAGDVIENYIEVALEENN